MREMADSSFANAMCMVVVELSSLMCVWPV